MIMNPNILNKNPLMFFDRAVKCPAQPAAYGHGRCGK